MDVFKLAGAAVITAVLAMTVKAYKPEMSVAVAAAGGAVILAYALYELSGTASAFREILNGLGIENRFLSPVLKVVGIAYMTQIAADICEDAGEKALASKTVICGRIMMLSAVFPVFSYLVGLLMDVTERYL